MLAALLILLFGVVMEGNRISPMVGSSDYMSKRCLLLPVVYALPSDTRSISLLELIVDSPIGQLALSDSHLGCIDQLLAL